MELQYSLTEYYDVSYDIKLQGQLNHAHWYMYEIMPDYIEICHDSDPDIVRACEIIGGEEEGYRTIDVWVEGTRRTCRMDIRKCSLNDDKAVYISIPVFAEDDARCKGPYDSDSNAGVIR
jgi:hypothetical protein